MRRELRVRGAGAWDESAILTVCYCEEACWWMWQFEVEVEVRSRIAAPRPKENTIPSYVPRQPTSHNPTRKRTSSKRPSQIQPTKPLNSTSPLGTSSLSATHARTSFAPRIPPCQPTVPRPLTIGSRCLGTRGTVAVGQEYGEVLLVGRLALLFVFNAAGDVWRWCGVCMCDGDGEGPRWTAAVDADA